MSTEELLQRTSKPPFRIERGILADKGQLFIVADESGNKYKQNICRLGYAYTKEGDDAREFNAELICRAVGSFEAMREVCCELIRKYETAAEEHAVREGVLAMADGLPYGETAVLPESPLVQLARKALALANNTEH